MTQFLRDGLPSRAVNAPTSTQATGNDGSDRRNQLPVAVTGVSGAQVMNLLQTVVVSDGGPDIVDLRIPLSPGKTGRNQVTSGPLSLSRSHEAADCSTCDWDPAINPMTPAAFGAGRDIDRAVFLRLTQRDPCIEQGSLLETQAQRSGKFRYRRDPLMPVQAKPISTLAHGLLIETRRSVGSCS